MLELLLHLEVNHQHCTALVATSQTDLNFCVFHVLLSVFLSVALQQSESRWWELEQLVVTRWPGTMREANSGSGPGPDPASVKNQTWSEISDTQVSSRITSRG